MYVVILAGGSGTRLWPRSRRRRPKHLLELVTERSMLQETFDRVSGAVPADNVLVVTEASHADAIREQLPELPDENVVELFRRGYLRLMHLMIASVKHFPLLARKKNGRIMRGTESLAGARAPVIG